MGIYCSVIGLDGIEIAAYDGYNSIDGDAERNVER
jgi:hypothetical protein